MEQLAYLFDPLKFEFKGTIVQKVRTGDGKFEILLEKTYFYPTGGGQPHDTGILGQAIVLDVFKDDTGHIVHRVDRDPGGPSVAAQIDADRRLGHMRHHSGQHILSRAFEEILGLDTLSVKISTNTASTLDLPLLKLKQNDLVWVEELANRIILENRPIKSYFITQDQINSIPFRRLPTVTGQIRVVEVDSFDYSACGGTHCPTTGMIGLVKIIKTEQKNKKLRLHFVTGQQALRHFQQYHQIITEITRDLSTSPDEVAALVSQQLNQLRSTQRELKRLENEMLSYEAQQLVEWAEPVASYKLVLALFPDRSSQELRTLAKLLQPEPDLIAVIAGYDNRRLSVVVICADNTPINAKELLLKLLDPINGSGGGDAGLAQGGGQATESKIETFFDPVKAYLRAAAK